MVRRHKFSLRKAFSGFSLRGLIMFAIPGAFAVMVFVAAAQLLRAVMNLVNGIEWIIGIVVLAAVHLWDTGTRD